MSKREMDIQNCSLINQRLGTISGDFSVNLDSLLRQIQAGLESTWRGGSANEYQRELEVLGSRFRQAFEELNSLNNRLASAVSAYKQVDEDFG